MAAFKMRSGSLSWPIDSVFYRIMMGKSNVFSMTADSAQNEDGVKENEKTLAIRLLVC
jgi:hypothetical protein